MESFFTSGHHSAQELRVALALLDRELEAGQAQVRERLAQQRSAISQLKSVRGALSDLAWEIEELDLRLRDLQAQRDGPHDPLVEREVASMLSRRAGMEERLLAQMLAADELAAMIAAEELALSAAQSAWSARVSVLQVDRAQVVELLAHIGSSSE